MLNIKGKLDVKIEAVELYKNNVVAQRDFSFGTWTSRQHAFVTIQSQGEQGYGENIMAVNEPEISLQGWGGHLKELVGLTIQEAIDLIRSKYDQWGGRCCEMAEIALIDLGGKLLKQSALEMLNLKGEKPVYGVYVILSDDVEFVSQQAKWAYEHGRASYIKVKLFGDLALDTAIVKGVRANTDDQTFLIGDVNTGYGKPQTSEDLEKIASQLKVLLEAGLDACEDPADMNHDQWISLQQMVGKLDLIPDVPMRPARVVVNQKIEGMGRIYNIHPGCMESIIDAVKLGNKIKAQGAKLMIGDDSLIGPACTVWQQLAIGLEADWVEALEKEGDSDDFYQAVMDISTKADQYGAIGYAKETHGFGLSLDVDRLRQDAVDSLHFTSLS